MKVLVLAGGFDQIALIKELKRRNSEVILADYYENPLAKRYADAFYRISTLDEEKIFQLAVKENVELVTTACTDQALLTVANVSKKMGLPCYLTPETAKNVTNKVYMKEKFKQHGIPTADCRVLQNEEEIGLLDNGILKFPCIVKPCDCNSSKGVIKVENDRALIKAAENAFRLSRSKKVIIEEYVSGMELSVDAWVSAGTPKILDITESRKIRQNNNNFTIYQSRYPVGISKQIEERIKVAIAKIVKAFGLVDCPLLVQAIVNENGVYVVEFSARMGGGSKYKLIEYLTGINIMDKYVDFIMGNSIEDIMPVNVRKSYELDYIYTYDGTISRYINFEELKKSGKIQDIFYYKTEGNTITGRQVSGDRALGLLIEGNNDSELEEKRKKILDTVAILDVSGKDIMYRECFC